MATQVDEEAILSTWGLRVESGHSQKWQRLGYEFGRMPFLRYCRYGGGKAHEDPYFRKYLVACGKEIEKEYPTWFYGVPGEDSAYKSVVKYLEPLSPPPNDVLAEATKWLSRHFNMLNGSRTNFDFKWITERMNKTSSPGFPFTRENKYGPGFNTKKEMLAYQDGEPARCMLADYLAAIAKPQMEYAEFYTLSAKAEMRKLKKIEADEFRTYTAASWTNTAAGIALFGTMLDSFYESYDVTWSYVGGSPFFGNWDKLYHRLNKHPNAYECDETNFDATVHPCFIEAIRDVFITKIDARDLTEAVRNMVNNLFGSIVSGLIICPNGDLFFKGQGNPSGSFMTIVTNTMTVFMLFCCAWLELAPVDLRNYESLMALVECAIVGDDNLWTASNEVRDWFNVRTVVAVWLRYGVKAKLEAMHENSLFALQFVSNGFIEVKGKMFPVANAGKAISSMLRHSNAHLGVKWSFIKACALRITTYFSHECRDLFKDYIMFLRNNYKTQLRYVDEKDVITWDILQKIDRTDFDIMKLYTCAENNRVHDEQGLSGLLRLIENTYATESDIQENERDRKSVV